MRFSTARRFALALPDTTEEPHHHYGSFRVHGRIFATVPPEQTHLHLFVTEAQREAALALYPGFIDKLLWGGKVVGLRVALDAADAATVQALLTQAWAHKASKRRALPRSAASSRGSTPARTTRAA